MSPLQDFPFQLTLTTPSAGGRDLGLVGEEQEVEILHTQEVVGAGGLVVAGVELDGVRSWEVDALISLVTRER